jgi:ferrous iron transport protein A
MQVSTRNRSEVARTEVGRSLAGLPIGVAARVVAIDGTHPVSRRMMEMGLVPGAPVSVVKAAPLGDPLHIRVRGYDLVLRRVEADAVTVDVSR